MNNVLNLRGCVLSKFKSIGEFAEAINWSRSKASRILNGYQSPDINDIQTLTELLNLNSPEIFMQIFFAPLSTKWTRVS